ncbi:MAG: Crp/Fnr family transcriptional regulator [Armatimonadota bacterium]|nr:Crp/Fnr family transcriptional regulator [Armatimonadota bacterium]MDR7528746.1 Crp/Fnr family transcriptional regulator [Armatimonadota bacterium]
MPDTIVSALLRRTQLFGDLSLPERLALAAALQRRDVPRDACVVRAGEPGQSFFLVAAGRIRVSLGRGPRAATLAELGPGDYFGELSLIDGEPRSADCIAVTRSELFELSRPDFFRLLDEHPGIARKLLVELCRRLREANRQIGTLAAVDAVGRVVRALLSLAERRARREGPRLVFPRAPAVREVALLAGLSQETTRRVMRQLSEQGLLHLYGRSLILHEERAPAADNLP